MFSPSEALWDALVDDLAYTASGPFPEDAEVNAGPEWWEDLERYCYLTGQEEVDVLPEVRGAALALLEERER